jgi:predicted amidohydrolase
MQIEANFARAASYIQKAASRGAHLAVLPEYHLTNWVPADPEFGKLCKQWKTYLNKYQALAKSLNINIVPGTIVEQHRDAESGNDILINVAYFIDNNGDILGKYQKKNLWYVSLNLSSLDESNSPSGTPSALISSPAPTPPTK